MKKISIASDHAGFEYKKMLAEYLKTKGYSVLDLGPDSTEKVDYPIFADKVCSSVQNKESDYGILICGTGIGMSIAANKHKGIRAGLCGDSKSATLTREHNNANVLCMGARIIPFETALEITDNFLKSEFLTGGDHENRVKMLDELL